MEGKLYNDYSKIEELFLVTNRRLSDSFERCKSSRVMPSQKEARIILNNKGLRSVKKYIADYKNLVLYAKPLFESIHHLLSDNGALFILTDDRSHILYVYGHYELLKSLSVTYNIHPGTSVSEDSVGTNAVALALHHKEMQIIKGSQHYCELFKTWTCIAIPIQIFNNEIIGSICIATPFISSLSEKIALTNYISSKIGTLIESDSIPIRENECVNQICTPKTPLTDRQTEVLVLFAKGFSYKEIARQLSLSSSKTVEEHLDAVCRKLLVKKRRECILQASKHGLL